MGMKRRRPEESVTNLRQLEVSGVSTNETDFGCLRREGFWLIVSNQESMMRRKAEPPKAPADQVVKDIRRQTRRHISAEDKIRIVLEGLRGNDSDLRPDFPPGIWRILGLIFGLIG